MGVGVARNGVGVIGVKIVEKSIGVGVGVVKGPSPGAGKVGAKGVAVAVKSVENSTAVGVDVAKMASPGAGKVGGIGVAVGGPISSLPVSVVRTGTPGMAS